MPATPGLGRSPGEGIGNPLQYSWVPLVAQMVKYLPAIRETCVQPLSWEDALQEGMATHSSTLAWRTPWTEEPGGLQSKGSLKSDMTEWLSEAQHTGRREGFPRWLRNKESTYHGRRQELNPWSWRFPGEENPIERGASYRATVHGIAESDMTEHTPRKMRTRRWGWEIGGRDLILQRHLCQKREFAL